VALGADLIRRLGGEVAALELLALLGDAVAERRVEVAQEWHPLAFTAGDLVELLLHSGGEGKVDVVAEVFNEEVGDDVAHQLGAETTLLDPDIAAVLDRRDRRRIRGRPPDAVLLERLDERRLGEPRGRLGEVLGRRHGDDARHGALGEDRQLALRLLLLGAVVATLRVDP
jgi:hypothetical protein